MNVSVRRTPFDAVDVDVSHVVKKLVDREFAPKSAITQLCAATIIRDEHIARLSLDLKEGERFTLLRDAIGAIDADEWISKASRLASGAAKRVNSASGELKEAKDKLGNSVGHLDQIRAELASVSGLRDSVTRLRALLGSSAPSDELGVMARTKILEIQTEIGQAEQILKQWSEVNELRRGTVELELRVEDAREGWRAAQESLEKLKADGGAEREASTLSSQARQLERLANLGHSIGVHDGHCPLCDSKISETQFRDSVEAVLALARKIDAQAVEQAERERALTASEEKRSKGKSRARSDFRNKETNE